MGVDVPDKKKKKTYEIIYGNRLMDQFATYHSVQVSQCSTHDMLWYSKEHVKTMGFGEFDSCRGDGPQQKKAWEL